MPVERRAQIQRAIRLFVTGLSLLIALPILQIILATVDVEESVRDDWSEDMPSFTLVRVIGAAATVVVLAILAAACRRLAGLDRASLITAPRSAAWLRRGAAGFCIAGALLIADLLFNAFPPVRLIRALHVPFFVASVNTIMIAALCICERLAARIPGRGLERFTRVMRYSWCATLAMSAAWGLLLAIAELGSPASSQFYRPYNSAHGLAQSLVCWIMPALIFNTVATAISTSQLAGDLASLDAPTRAGPDRASDAFPDPLDKPR
jgi:hypothetical protein